MKPSALCFAIFVCGFVECRTCTAEAQPARAIYDFRSGAGPARKGDAGADDVSSRGADLAATQQALPAMRHGTGIIHSQPARVDAATVCAVQNALRWQTPAWPVAECERVAAALDTTPSPLTFGAIMVNESDMTRAVWRESMPGVYDVGPMGIRCVTDGAHARAGRRSASVNHKSHAKPQPPRGRCTNGPARGLTIQKLMDPVVAIRVAAKIVASKPRLGNYNAKDPVLAQRYEDKIALLASALAGLPVDPKKLQGRKRLRILVEKIQWALRFVSKI